MLNERQIELLPERIYQRIRAVNTEYLESIGNVIKEIGELRPTDVHQLQQMYNYGADIDKITKKLSDISGKNIEDIYEMFDIVAKENYSYSKPFYKAKGLNYVPYEKNEDLKQYVKNMAKQTVNEYVNLTQNTAFAIFADKGKEIAPLYASNKLKVATSLSDTYNKVVDYAVSKVQLGESSYNSAIKEVLEALASSGIRTVDYATGYSRRLDTSVRQNVLWGIKQCNQNTADKLGEEFGADGYEISYHSNPRPSHSDMGGKQYAIGKARTLNGVYYPSFDTVAHLLEEYNCLHFKFSIILGVSVPTYDNDELEALKAEDKKEIEFEGEKYDKYGASQLQRRIETEIRNQKDLGIIAKAAGNDELRQEVQLKLNHLASKYSELSKVSGLPTKMERMQVKGFSPVKAKSTQKGQADYKTIVNRKYDEKQYNRYKELLGSSNVPETLDKFQQMKYNDIEAWEDLKYYALNISGRPIEYVKIERTLKKEQLIKGTVVAPEPHKAYILEDLSSKDPAHIMKRMYERNISADDVQHYVDTAVFSLSQRQGERIVYYSAEGVTVLTKTNDYIKTDWITKTTWNKHDYDEAAERILEVAKKYVK